MCTFLTFLNFFALPSQLNLFNFPPETDYSTNLTFRWISSFSSNIQLKLDGVKHLLIFSNIIVHWGAGLLHGKRWKLFADLDRHNVYKKTKDSLIYIPNTSNSVVRFLWKESQIGEERKLKYFQAWGIFLLFGLQRFHFLKLNCCLAQKIRILKLLYVFWLRREHRNKKWWR